jgi:drug/metabolite transporter (DMT)-like permease
MVPNKILKSKLFFVIVLLIVAAIWGISFVAMKNTLARIDVISFLAWRFLIAAIFLMAARPKFYLKLTWQDVGKGVIAGTLLSSGYIGQTIGLIHSTVSKTGVITGMYLVFTPFVCALFLKVKVTKIQWLATALATIGLFLLSFTGLHIGFGEVMVLLGALLFALHIISLGKWAHQIDVYGFAVVQLTTGAILELVVSEISGFHAPKDLGVWEAVLFTALMATAFAFVMQTLAQSVLPATSVAVILTMEVPFAAIFGIWLKSDPLTLRIGLGAILMIIAIYIIVLADRFPASKDPFTVAGSLHD